MAANRRFDAAATAEARPSNAAAVASDGSCPSTTITLSPEFERARAATAPTRPPPTMRISAVLTFKAFSSLFIDYRWPQRSALSSKSIKFIMTIF